MNLITLKVDYEAQIKIYKDFVPFTQNSESMFKLMREIYNLSMKVDKLKMLSFNDLVKPCNFYFERGYSRINNKLNNLDKKIYY